MAVVVSSAEALVALWVGCCCRYVFKATAVIGSSTVEASQIIRIDNSGEVA